MPRPFAGPAHVCAAVIAAVVALALLRPVANSAVSAEEAALRRVIAESGTDCLQGADISWSPDLLEATAISRDITDGWIDEGFSWVGSGQGLVSALGGVALPGSADALWVQVGKGTATHALHYRRIPSASAAIWVRTGSISVAEATACLP